MDVLIAVAIALAACALLYRATRPRGSRKRSVAELRAELRRATHDSDVAERLLDRMRRRHPEASERTIVRLALAELRADRRR